MKQKIVCFLALFIMFSGAVIALEQAPVVGNSLPGLSLPNLEGKTTNIQDISNQKPLILTFFTSWSKPCQDELAELEKIANENPKVQVIGVSFDKKFKDLKISLTKLGISFPVLLDKKLSSIDKYQILIIPTTFCISKEGIIEKIFIDYDENVKTAIEEWIKP